MSALHRLSLLGAAALLAGCASVSPDGLRGDVAALTAGRTGGVQATLPAADPAARAQAQRAVERQSSAQAIFAAIRVAFVVHADVASE